MSHIQKFALIDLYSPSYPFSRSEIRISSEDPYLYGLFLKIRLHAGLCPVLGLKSPPSVKTLFLVLTLLAIDTAIFNQ